MIDGEPGDEVSEETITVTRSKFLRIAAHVILDEFEEQWIWESLIIVIMTAIALIALVSWCFWLMVVG